MVRIICDILIVLGFIIIFGSVGAMDTDNISVLQCALQSLIGIGLLIPKVVHELYLKYHNTI